jgi:hypothetical protein
LRPLEPRIADFVSDSDFAVEPLSHPETFMRRTEWLAMRFRAPAHALVAQMEYALLICGDDQQPDRPLLDRADRFVTEFVATFATCLLRSPLHWQILRPTRHDVTACFFLPQG